MELIIAALIAGATAAAKDTAEKGVKDAYEVLKTLIKKRFAGDALAQAWKHQSDILIKSRKTREKYYALTKANFITF